MPQRCLRTLASPLQLASLLTGLAAAATDGNVELQLFVASKCPDASRCENVFLPFVLARVGSIVDLRVDYIGELNSSAPLGVACMHGDSECEGDAVQLCTRRYFPVSHDIATLGRHSWFAFQGCVGHFNHTNESQIPQNTDECLASFDVPADIIDQIDACAAGEEGRELLRASVQRTIQLCGHHTSSGGCRSCTMQLNGKKACVVDEGEFIGCPMGHDVDLWVEAICKEYSGPDRPLACDTRELPQVVGHSFASTDPGASGDFAVRYFGAEFVTQHPDEVQIRLPSFDDFRGGGLVLRFARSAGSPGGWYDVPAFVQSMSVLAGNLSDNTRYQWNQFFDNHLGFYVRGQSKLAARLLGDGVPFWTGIDGGYYQSVYVAIPGIGSIVEVLGDFTVDPPLPSSHIRIGSTQQFCTPYRGPGQGRRLRIPGPGGADMKKTTMAAPDPEAVVQFAVQYLGASAIHQRRGVVADGECATLKWARWPDGHEWHVVNTFSTDWVDKDHLRPAVPFNITEFAAYVDGLRDLRGGVYDQYLDYREVLVTQALEPVCRRLAAGGVAFLPARTAEGACSVIASMPGGLAVEVRAANSSSACCDGPRSIAFV